MKEMKLMLQIRWGNTPLNLETIEESLLKDEYSWRHKIKEEKRIFINDNQYFLDGLCSAARPLFLDTRETKIKVTACLREHPKGQQVWENKHVHYDGTKEIFICLCLSLCFRNASHCLLASKQYSVEKPPLTHTFYSSH